MQKKGFTLLEMLIVVIIIGVLAAIALPQYTSTIEKGRSGEAALNLGGLRTAMDRYWYENTSYTTLNGLDIDNPNSVTNKLYLYAIDSSSAGSRSYTLSATRTSGGNTYWLKWRQSGSLDGKLLRSSNLGGPTT